MGFRFMWHICRVKIPSMPIDFRALVNWIKPEPVRLMRYVSISKLERLESDGTNAGTIAVSVLGSGGTLSQTRNPGIQSRIRRVEKALRKSQQLGTLSDSGRFQFLICDHQVREFVAQGVVVWLAPLENGYVVSGGSATYLDRNADVFTSKGIMPGSNPSGYYAGLSALYRQALDATGTRLVLSRSELNGWPSTEQNGWYHAENDPGRPARSSIWRIEPKDDVIATNLDLDQIFRMARVIHQGASDPRGVRARQLLLVHTDYTFENLREDLHVPNGARLVIGSPLYVEQLAPAGG
jgi:hypothetical protein